MVDVKGAFLHGQFDSCEILYCKIPERFADEYNPKKYCWLLKKSVYGLNRLQECFGTNYWKQ